MGNQRMDVRIPDSTFSAIKNRAVAEGTSASEIVRRAIEATFRNPLKTGEGSVVSEQRAGSPQEIDTDKFRDTVSETNIEVLKRGEGGVPPEVLRFLVASVTRLDWLLRQISLEVFSPVNHKKHEERYRIADQMADTILKKLNLFEVENVDKIEVNEMKKEETDQFLKEMGIETGGEN